RMCQRIAMRGSTRWLATLGCLLPLALGFAVPVVFLAREPLLRHLLQGLDPALPRHTVTTVWFAATATVLVVPLGSIAAATVRVGRTRLVAGAIAIATMGYAIPGTVLALGLLGPVVTLDNAINWVAQHTTGAHPGLVVAGSSAAVVAAYVVRFLAIAIGL